MHLYITNVPHNSLFQEVLQHKDEGFQCLQAVVDAAQLVQASTSPAGKDIITEDLHGLRQDWDDMLTLMNDGKTRLETAVNQWDLHDNTLATLNKWLTDMEETLKQESALQSTLSEKRSQLERVKVSTQYTDRYISRILLVHNHYYEIILP